MNTLERYKKLSKEDKNNITVYSMYNSIYSIADNENYEISDGDVERIKELSYYVYLKDGYYNLSPSKISDFITECYICHNVSLEKMEDAHWSDILEAIDNNNCEFCMSEEMER